MPLITLQDAELAFGLQPLLDRAALVVDDREHIGLIGRNGTGKSSLLQAIHGTLELDGGDLKRRDGLRTVLVEQEPQLPSASTIRESLALRGKLHVPAGDTHDEREHWRTEARLVEFLHRFELKDAMPPALASGGERKRAALALAFALSPDLLLLDEPTNHLDLDGISLLEKLLGQQAASIVITHDRMFLDRVTTRIVELDRGLLRSYPGNFAAYAARRTEELSAELIANRKFDTFWKQEEAWIRKGVEARRTRDMGRVRRLDQLRSERAARRERQRNVTMTLHAAERSGKLVAEFESVSKGFGERVVVRGLDLRIMRGDRLGIIGPNGAGKSTLLKLILGTMTSDAGRVRRGTKLQATYFDQMREQLDDDRTLADAISPGGEWIETQSGRKHVLSYLGDFLFPPQRANAPVRTLSGGERNRLLLARLFAQPANLLVLDEPTNDLDIESLEILEETLQSYPGTLLVVSHDRAFLDNVVTQTLVSEGDGRWREYVGGYSDWVAQRPVPAAPPAASGPTARVETVQPRQRTGKLSFKEQRELDALPAALDALEQEQIALGERMAAHDYYIQGAEAMRADRARAAEIETLLAAKLERWVELEGRVPSKE
jgi:ATP-binding cassette subfamily F protein uup